MKIFLCFFLFAVAQDVPFKNSSEFEIKLDYEFKQRPGPDHNTVLLGAANRNRQTSTHAVLPYLVLRVNLLKLPHEKTRMKITTNLEPRPVVKRVSVNSPIELDLGFTADMIDRITAHEYTLTFLDESKTPVNKIVIAVQEDRSFLVNGEKRGQF